jgi:hypothetical protein
MKVVICKFKPKGFVYLQKIAMTTLDLNIILQVGKVLSSRILLF